MRRAQCYGDRMKSPSLLLCVAIALLFAPRASAYCNDPQPRLVCAEYFNSDLVVEATLVRTTYIPYKKDDPDDGFLASIYTLRVDRVIRGKTLQSVTVYEGNDSGRATFSWTPGRKYLLFLFRHTGDNPGDSRDELWSLDGCGNSGPVSKATRALSEIAAIKTAHGGGVIHGAIRWGEAPDFSNYPSGVRIEARGTAGRFTAITNKDGEFRISVPAGNYILNAARRGLTFTEDDFSYEDPSNIRIAPGACAQIELDASETSAIR
jgi:hypothetical protein